MIDCPNGDVRDLLPDYLHDRLESSVRMSVERHLAECAACRDELALLRDLRGTLGRTPRIDVAAVAAAIPAYRPPARTSWATGWRAAAAITAIAVGGASIALLARPGQPPRIARGPVAAPATPAHEIGSAAAPRTTAQLPATAMARSVPSPTPTEPHTSASVKPLETPRGEELAIASGTIADLSDGELSDLIGDLDSLDAVPSTDVEATESLLTGRHRGRHE